LEGIRENRGQEGGEREKGVKGEEKAE